MSEVWINGKFNLRNLSDLLLVSVGKGGTLGVSGGLDRKQQQSKIDRRHCIATLSHTAAISFSTARYML